MNKPPMPQRGIIQVPGDKSISHRAAIMAALGRGKSCLRGFLRADDTLNTLKIFQALGLEIAGLADDGDIIIEGRGLRGLREAADILYSGNSGTTTRLLTGLLSAQPFFSVISGDASLNQRPMGRIITPLSRMGAAIWGRRQHTMPPLAIQGKKLSGINYESPVPSAQIKSALMLAGMYADGPLSITEPSLSRDHTERIFNSLGIPVHTSIADSGSATISMSPATQDYCGTDFVIPGDISAAAFFLVAALINRGSELTVTKVGINPTRSGILQALQAMGADIVVENRHEAGGEPVADLTVHGCRQLQGTEISGSLIPRLIDEIPILALAAAHAEGTTTIRNARELRVKESDRLQAIALLLEVLGVRTESLDDGIIIHGGTRVPAAKRPLSFKTFHDHRIAMTAMVAGAAAGREVELDDNQCISTSFPHFSQLLADIQH